jgi:tetratricopeptide (TPR) repeat protein
MKTLLQRAWILLELSVRAASDKSMIILVDLSGQAKDYFSNALKSEEGGLTRPKRDDYFGQMTAYLKSDVTVIQKQISALFHNDHFEGTGLKPKDMFNGTITDFVYFAGGLMHVWEAVREGRHNFVTAVGWELAQTLQDRGKFQDSLEVWNAVLSSTIEVFNGHDHIDVAKSYWGIGNVYRRLGRYDEVRKMPQNSD